VDGENQDLHDRTSLHFQFYRMDSHEGLYAARQSQGVPLTEKSIMNLSMSPNDGLDATKVPYQTVYTGAKIPAIGLGTFGSDRYSGEAIAGGLPEHCG